MKKIIVTEKPSVGRTFAQVLGVTGNHDGYIENENWIITWCIGHLVTLAYPESYDESLKKWNMEDLPFLPEKYKYQVIPNVQKQFNVIKSLYNRDDIDTIYYAGDPAREGIYLQNLVREQAGVKPGVNELVVWIDSQTSEEIKRGIKEAKPLSTYQDLIDSGYVRAIEDFALGINLSRAFTLRYQNLIYAKNPIAVGRVMTCVLGMVVQREEEIENFTSTTYYKIASNIEIDNKNITAIWRPKKDSEKLYNKTGFLSKSDAEEFISLLGPELTIESINTKEEKKSAPLLFNLAELQAACSKKFHISPNETLEVAQSLYEKKLTTYPRTDARYLSSAIAKEVDDILTNLKGYNSEISTFVDFVYTNPKGTSWIEKSKYTNDNKISDHYALIPTGQNINLISSLSELERNVYDLIVRRFISIFMPPAKYKKISIVEVDKKTDERFYASSSNCIRPGYLSVVGIPESKNTFPDAILDVKNGDIFPSVYNTVESETKPPSRYTSGSMILAMENAGNLIEDEELREQIKGSGIGTSATRAETINKLVKTECINLNNKTQILTPKPFGIYIYEVVKASVPALLSPKMTANWELGLDKIAKGEIDANNYLDKLNAFIEQKVNIVKHAELSSDLRNKVEPLKDKIPTRRPTKEAATGIWMGQEIKFAREWGGHRFTDDEVTKLLNNEIISFTAKSKAGKDYTATGKLEIQTYKNKKYVGFKVDFSNNAKDVPDEWCSHIFLPEEKEALRNGQVIYINDFVSKKGNSFACEVKFGKNEKGYMGIIPLFN